MHFSQIRCRNQIRVNKLFVAAQLILIWSLRLYRDRKVRHKVHLINEIIGAGHTAETRSGSSFWASPPVFINGILAQSLEQGDQKPLWGYYAQAEAGSIKECLHWEALLWPTFKKNFWSDSSALFLPQRMSPLRTLCYTGFSTHPSVGLYNYL